MIQKALRPPQNNSKFEEHQLRSHNYTTIVPKAKRFSRRMSINLPLQKQNEFFLIIQMRDLLIALKLIKKCYSRAVILPLFRGSHCLIETIALMRFWPSLMGLWANGWKTIFSFLYWCLVMKSYVRKFESFLAFWRWFWIFIGFVILELNLSNWGSKFTLKFAANFD